MRVHNKYHNTAPANAVYIGRGSKWGNPYVIGKHGTREEVIEKYKRDLEDSMKNPRFVDQLLELEGRELVCFCKPAPCHGDVLVDKVYEARSIKDQYSLQRGL